MGRLGVCAAAEGRRRRSRAAGVAEGSAGARAPAERREVGRLALKAGTRPPPSPRLLGPSFRAYTVRSPAARRRSQKGSPLRWLPWSLRCFPGLDRPASAGAPPARASGILGGDAHLLVRLGGLTSLTWLVLLFHFSPPSTSQRSFRNLTRILR